MNREKDNRVLLLYDMWWNGGHNKFDETNPTDYILYSNNFNNNFNTNSKARNLTNYKFKRFVYACLTNPKRNVNRFYSLHFKQTQERGKVGGNLQINVNFV